MLYLDRTDFYEINLGSMLASYDREILTMLYQPFISSDAVSLFFTLWSEYKKQDICNISNHDHLIKVLGISIDDLQIARKKLEAVGLLKSYYRKEKGIGFYKYVLFSPKTPDEFFDDILFKGMLIKAMGEKEVARLANYFKNKNIELDGYAEVSDSFRNVFAPDLNDPIFMNGNFRSAKRGRKILNISSGFDTAVFLKSLKDNHQILSSSITETDLDEISRLSLLFGIDAESMADIVSLSYNASISNHIDFDLVYNYASKLNSGGLINRPVETENNEFINTKSGEHASVLSNTSPFDFLKLRQGYTNPSPSDIALINELSREYNLTPGVINTLIEYVLNTHDNQLPRNLVLKIASSLARSKITSALDAMNYLYKNKENRREYGKNNYYNRNNTKENRDNTNDENNEPSEEEIEKLMKELDELEEK